MMTLILPGIVLVLTFENEWSKMTENKISFAYKVHIDHLLALFLNGFSSATIH
jgi:hypothetical protein